MLKQIPLNALRTFEAVATCLSFSGGAQALNVTPAAVSSQIRALEELLGLPLFVRHGRKITLTDAGRALLPGVQSGLAQITQALQSLRTEREQGVLNVSMLPSFLQKWLTPRLHEFYRLHAEIDLRINADTALVNFQESDFHAAIRFGRGNWPGLAIEKLLDDWAVPVCSAALLDQYGAVENAAELDRYPLLHSEDEPWDDWLDGLKGKTARRRGPVFNDSLSIAVAAQQGLGLGLARWSLVAAELESRQLVRPISIASKSEFAYYFVAPPHYLKVPKIAKFRAWLKECCSAFAAPE